MMNKMLIEFMNINAKHGRLSSAIKSPEHKTENRINSPSDVFRASNKNILCARKSWESVCTDLSVLFKTISDLSFNFARGSGIRLRALLNKSCEGTEIFFKHLIIKDKI